MPSAVPPLYNAPLIILEKLQTLIQHSLLLEAEALRNPHNEEVNLKTTMLAEDIEALTQELEALERGLGECFGVTGPGSTQPASLRDVPVGASVRSPRRKRLRRVGKFERRKG